MKVALLTTNGFWNEPLGCGTLVRNRYRLLVSLVDTVEVLFFTNDRSEKCPLAGSYTIVYDGRKSFTAEVSAFLKQKSYDVLYCNYDRFWGFIESVRALKILEMHDVMHLRQESFRRFGYEPPINTSKDAEMRSLARYDWVLSLNTDEAIYLSDAGVRNILYVPPNFEQVLETPYPKANAVGVIGSSAKPNIDGLRHYMRSICSMGELVVAGSISRHSILDEVQVNALRLGLIDDPAEFYKRIAVALAPIRFGGGIKIKAIEALAHLRPVFGTSHSLAGLPEGIERVSCRYDELSDWNAEHVEEALAVSTEAIREYIETNFIDEACAPALREVLNA